MAIKRPKAKVFTEEQTEALRGSIEKQEIVTAAPKSADPENFPVFEVPVNSKVMIYVPNHVVMKDGVENLRMDRPLIHPVKDGKRFLNFRCIRGLTELGYSGECSLCDGTSEPWDLANLIISKRCKAQNLNPEDRENDTVKAIRSAEFDKRVIKEPTEYFTFPVVLIETEAGDYRKPVLDEDGNLIVTPMWYTISKAAYDKKWKPMLEGMEDDPIHPGGYTFILNYEYHKKGDKGEPNKRDSARNLVVTPRSIKNFGEVASKLDEMTKDWTPEKAIEVVLNNTFFEEEELEKVTDEILLQTRQYIELYSDGQDVTKGIESKGDAGFDLSKPEVPEEEGVDAVESDLDTE